MRRHWYLLGRPDVPLERRIIGTVCASLGGAFLVFQAWRLGYYLMGNDGGTKTISEEMPSWVSGAALIAIGMLAGLAVAAAWRSRQSPRSERDDEKIPPQGITIDGEVLRKDD